MKTKLKRLWRWLTSPPPPEGMKYADNPDLPGLAPTDVEPMPQSEIDAIQAEQHGFQAKEFMRLNDMQRKIAQFVHANYGEDAASGLHSRIGGDFGDMVVYYLKRERWFQRNHDANKAMMLAAKSFIKEKGLDDNNEEPTV